PIRAGAEDDDGRAIGQEHEALHDLTHGAADLTRRILCRPGGRGKTFDRDRHAAVRGVRAHARDVRMLGYRTSFESARTMRVGRSVTKMRAMRRHAAAAAARSLSVAPVGE